MKNRRRKRKPIAKHLKYATSLDTLWGDIDIFQADIKLIFNFRANTPQTMTYNTLQYMPFSKIEKIYGKHGITRYEAPQHGTFLEGMASINDQVLDPWRNKHRDRLERISSRTKLPGRPLRHTHRRKDSKFIAIILPPSYRRIY